jgi:hypothetical protein
MRDLIILLVHVFTAIVRVGRPGGVRAAIVESILTKHQLSTFLNFHRDGATQI